MISAIIGKYALPFVGGLAVVSVGLTVALAMNRDRLKSEIAALKGELNTCAARNQNLIEDKKSDATVNDPRDYDVPDRWLMPETDG